MMALMCYDVEMSVLWCCCLWCVLFQLYPELNLTEEEQKLLSQEGVSLPNNLPLTKVQHDGDITTVTESPAVSQITD